MIAAFALVLLVAGADAGAPATDAGANVNADVTDAGVAPVVDAGTHVVADAGAHVVADAGAHATVVDAGAHAIVVDAGVAAAAPEHPEAVVAIVHERPTPLAFRVAANGKSARQRANDAASAITAALDAEVVGAAAATVKQTGDVAVVEVRGRAVGTLTKADAEAEGTTLDAYAGELETRMSSFVQDEERRSSLQALALRFFFSVLLCVLGFVTLRALRKAFTTWETRLDERGPINPLRILGQPILSSDALRAVLAVGLLGARILAYVGVAGVVVAAVLGQFEATRPLLARFATFAAAPIVAFVNGVIGAVPGVVLAAVLLVAVRASIRFAQLLFDGVAEGRVSSRIVEKTRVFPARVVVVTVVTLVTAPLVAAAAFGRFGTPLETLALCAGGVALLASVPVLACGVVGVVVLWRGTVKPGDWVEIGDAKGEVASVHLIDVVLVPDHGGTVHVPQLAFIFKPVKQLKAPRAELPVEVRRDRALDKIEAALVAVAKKAGDDGGVELIDARGNTLHAVLFVPIAKPGAREVMVRALVAAVERGDVELADNGVGAGDAGERA